MRIETLSLQHFRNLETMEIAFDPKVNLICGDNGQGKTNLIEAIWLLTGARSFRGNRDGDLVRFGEERAKIEAKFFSQMRDQEISIQLGPKRQSSLNGVAVQSGGELSENFGAVVFSPVHLEIVKEGPQQRRRFLDTAIGQIKERYQKYLQNLNRILLQRNNLLRDVPFHGELRGLLDVYDEHLAQTSAVITVMRRSYIEKLKIQAEDIYREISGGREALSLRYIPSIDGPIEGLSGEELKEVYLAAIQTARENDIAYKTTSVGPHRDDLEITLDGLSARSFGSQGQQRSCVLALKLSEGRILKEVLDDNPVILLDDVLSELDAKRQAYLLREMTGMQVFITCCDPHVREQMEGGALFFIERGALTREQKEKE
ncbi:DNA replication/repair protein RecF [Zongyangia hominis]|uniref:DNA replication and repair protein RecF n=1 Tax=Zongyangia hominis TaxID=2763677 RepID=A0A926EB39_9FIRM|nr:DNA replication/repair protein RecF [Zongyangia hominis]MBC8570637.1 DNA replication/repair protein RecF [Zongyangia hominis]